MGLASSEWLLTKGYRQGNTNFIHYGLIDYFLFLEITQCIVKFTAKTLEMNLDVVIVACCCCTLFVLLLCFICLGHRNRYTIYYNRLHGLHSIHHQIK